MTIDIDHLEHATAGDRALQAELLRMFRSQVRELSDMIDRGGVPIGAPDLAARLHRLKGAARAIGAEPLAAALAEAESDLHRSAPDEFPKRELEALADVLRETAGAVDALLGAHQRAGLANAGESG